MTPQPTYPGLTGRKLYRLRMADGGWRIRIKGGLQSAARNHPSSIINYPFVGGFTLLELLVAMSLMVVVASCLYTALYTGFRAYQSAQAAVDPTSTAMNVIELLKQDIRGVLPPGSHLAGAFIGTDSAGLKGVDTDSLEFYTTHVYVDDTLLTGSTTTNTPLVGGIGKIGLLLEEDSETKDGTYLLLRQVTTDLLAPKEMEPEEQVLCRSVASLNFRYFDGSNWLDEWDSTADANSLPLAVEIDLEVAHHDKHSRESQKRRLVQSFALPCKSAPAESSTTSGTSTSSTTKSSTSASNSTKSTSTNTQTKTSGS